MRHHLMQPVYLTLECLVSEICLDWGSALQMADLLSVPHTILLLIPFICSEVVLGLHVARCLLLCRALLHHIQICCEEFVNAQLPWIAKQP